MAVLFVPQLAEARIPFFGPILPSEAFNPALCPTGLGWGAVIVVINNVIEFALTIILVFLAPIMIAYSGFLYVVNPFKPDGLAKARSLLLSTVVGIVVALGAWMIVSALMAVLYHPDPNKGFTENWASIINSGGQGLCLSQQGAAPSSGGGSVTVIGVEPITQPTPVTPPTSGGPSMSQTAIQTAANKAQPYRNQVCAAASVNGISGQCNQLLGILGVESNGNPNARPPGGGEGEIGLMQLKPSTAAMNGVAACVGSSDLSPSAECAARLQDPTANINAGVRYYAGLYREFRDSRNATAAYNGGNGRGSNADGTRQAFAPSRDCIPPTYPSGMYAWECPINPGGFAGTQSYVANVASVAARVAN